MNKSEYIFIAVLLLLVVGLTYVISVSGLEVKEVNEFRESGKPFNYSGVYQDAWSSGIPERECQEWEKEIKYYCDDINGDGLNLSDCILNKCYAKDESKDKQEVMK